MVNEENANANDFDTAPNVEVLPGAEHLGRAILDEQGMPSGSPANYENLRGKTGLEVSDEDKASAVAAAVAEVTSSLAPREDV